MIQGFGLQAVVQGQGHELRVLFRQRQQPGAGRGAAGDLIAHSLGGAEGIQAHEGGVEAVDNELCQGFLIAVLIGLQGLEGLLAAPVRVIAELDALVGTALPHEIVQGAHGAAAVGHHGLQVLLRNAQHTQTLPDGWIKVVGALYFLHGDIGAEAGQHGQGGELLVRQPASLRPQLDGGLVELHKFMGLEFLLLLGAQAVLIGLLLQAALFRVLGKDRQILELVLGVNAPFDVIHLGDGLAVFDHLFILLDAHVLLLDQGLGAEHGDNVVHAVRLLHGVAVGGFQVLVQGRLGQPLPPVLHQLLLARLFLRGNGGAAVYDAPELLGRGLVPLLLLGNSSLFLPVGIAKGEEAGRALSGGHLLHRSRQHGLGLQGRGFRENRTGGIELPGLQLDRLGLSQGKHQDVAPQNLLREFVAAGQDAQLVGVLKAVGPEDHDPGRLILALGYAAVFICVDPEFIPQHLPDFSLEPARHSRVGLRRLGIESHGFLNTERHGSLSPFLRYCVWFLFLNSVLSFFPQVPSM